MKTRTLKTKIFVSVLLVLVIAATALGVCFSTGAFAWSSKNFFEIYNADSNTWSRTALDDMAKKITIPVRNTKAAGIDDLVKNYPSGSSTIMSAVDILGVGA